MIVKPFVNVALVPSALVTVTFQHGQGNLPVRLNVQVILVPLSRTFTLDAFIMAFVPGLVKVTEAEGRKFVPERSVISIEVVFCPLDGVILLIVGGNEVIVNAFSKVALLPSLLVTVRCH